MILTEYYSNYQTEKDILNAQDINENPFEYLIKTIYENQMIIQETNLRILSEEYSYLRDYGEEPILIGEGGIISSIFGALFKMLSNAFKAICAFFKNIFSRNKSTIESTSMKTKEDTKQNKTMDKSSNTTQSSNAGKTNMAKEPTKPKRDLEYIYKEFCSDAIKNPSKYGIDNDIFIIDCDKLTIDQFASQYTNNIINCVEEMCDDISDRYKTIISVYDSELKFYDYFGEKPDSKEYLKNNPHSIDSYLKASDKLSNARYATSSYGQWAKKHISELMVDNIPDYVKQSDIKEMYNQYMITHCLIKMTDSNKLSSLLNGKSEYIDFHVIGSGLATISATNTVKINTKPLYQLNDKCISMFNNAKAVISKAEKELKSIQQIAQGAENVIKSSSKVLPTGGKTGDAAKSELIKYFNSLGQVVTYLISTATTTNAQVSSAFAKLITHCINNNSSAAQKLANFADTVHNKAFIEFMENGDQLVL